MSEETDGTIAGAEGVEAPVASETLSEQLTEQTTGADEVGLADDAGEAAEEPAKRVPWFQKRIDEVTAKKYEAEREASYWKGIAEGRSVPQAQPVAETLPTLEQFDYDEGKYQAALTKHITEQAEKGIDRRLTQRDAEQAELQKNNTAIERLKSGGSKHPDFIAAVSGITATVAVRDFLLDDTGAADVLYELGKDSAAAERFNNLSPVQQAIELGKRSATPKPAPSKAIPPPPPQTVTGAASGIGKTLDQMSYAEFKAAREEQEKTRN